MKKLLVIAAFLLAGAGCLSDGTTTGTKPRPIPPPQPVPGPDYSECRSYASCMNNAACPAGLECSGLPAYGCFPPGCPTPICLASNAFIATPDAEIRVQELEEGMMVWTLDKDGNKVAAPILKISRASVSDGHRVMRLVLEDGRQVWASPGHPTADGRDIATLKANDAFDGSVIETIEPVPYWDDTTYDLLPAGDTGAYWANGILLGSTLR